MYAKKFERHLVKILHYQTLNVLSDMVIKILLHQTSYQNVLDLGCGAGWRPNYRSLRVRNVVAFPRQRTGRFYRFRLKVCILWEQKGPSFF